MSRISCERVRYALAVLWDWSGNGGRLGKHINKQSASYIDIIQFFWQLVNPPCEKQTAFAKLVQPHYWRTWRHTTLPPK